MQDIRKIIPSISSTEVIYFISTFAVILITARFGQLIFFEWKTSPAILWPPTGLGVAFIWLGGYRYAVPIFFGLFVAFVTGPTSHMVPAVVTTPLAQVLGQIGVVYLLRRYGFDGIFSRMRHVLVFLGAVIVACMIAPTITTCISWITGNLTTLPYISWSRSWSGYIFSCLIITPLLLTWRSRPDPRIPFRSKAEMGIVAVCLILSVYLLFWTRIASNFSFLLFAFFFIINFWICYRFSIKILTYSVFVTTVVGILGLFLSPNPERSLNAQLFASELFFFFVIPIFYLFSTLVKERTSTVIELTNAMNRIEKENVSKNNFIAVLAHELRNPLAPVKTTLEVLGLQERDLETKKLIERALQQVRTMRRLLDDLLDVTRVREGKFQLQVVRSNLYNMLQNSIAVAKTIFDKGHAFTIDTSSDRTIMLDVDPVRFEQSITNILNNASKYTTYGGNIDVSYTRNGETVEIRIQDNGDGIEADNLENIFETFWQTGDSSASSGGLGLGLSLTRSIIEMQGGTIRAESEGKGKGSTFVISMPTVKEEIAVQNPNQHVKKLETSLCTIVVVDDNRAAADSLVKLLSLKGHTALAVYSGKEALRVVRANTPEVILLDVGLPDISGHEVATRLRTLGFKGRILALSGYGLPEDKERALSAGCDAHFTKPMSIARLEEYLMEHGVT